MSKNGNGEGSIYPHKRNGKKVGYRGAYVVSTAVGPKRRYVTGKDRDDVRQKLTKAMADRDGGLVFDAGSLTVGEYLERCSGGPCPARSARAPSTCTGTWSTPTSSPAWVASSSSA